MALAFGKVPNLDFQDIDVFLQEEKSLQESYITTITKEKINLGTIYFNFNDVISADLNTTKSIC